MPDTMQAANIFFMKSSVILQDNPFDILEQEEVEIDIFQEKQRYEYQQRITSETKVEDREYVKIYFRAENARRVYQRQGYDILAYLGDLGGLLDVLLVVGKVMTAIFTSKLFIAALISEAYRI